MHGGQLSYKEWDERLQAVEAQLQALKPPVDSPGLDEKHRQAEATVDSALLDDATTLESASHDAAPMTEKQKEAAIKKAAEEATTSELMTRLQLTRKYYTEAIRFIEVLHAGTPIVCQLLSSKNKSEVIEAMDFFVVIDAYKIEAARTGIRRMLRLIWTKGNSDEGKGVQTHLIDCYRGLFFSAPNSFGENDEANYVARNMISLTFGATPAELTSLEQLLNTMVKADHVSDLVVTKLWQVYGVQKQDISKNQRRGAIIVLGMLATADPEIVVKEMGTILRVGLGPLGRSDLALAKYTCLALRRMNPTKRQGQDGSAAAAKLPNDHAILTKLAAMVEVISDSKEWYVQSHVSKAYDANEKAGWVWLSKPSVPSTRCRNTQILFARKSCVGRRSMCSSHETQSRLRSPWKESKARPDYHLRLLRSLKENRSHLWLSLSYSSSSVILLSSKSFTWSFANWTSSVGKPTRRRRRLPMPLQSSQRGPIRTS